MAISAPKADMNRVASWMHVIADPSSADVDLTAITKAPAWAAQMLELTNVDGSNPSAIVLTPEGFSSTVTLTLGAGEQRRVVRYPIASITASGSDTNIRVVAYWWDPGGSVAWNF